MQFLVQSPPPPEVLTTHKVWGEVLFDHFQFCSILSNIGFKSYKLIGNSYKTKCVGVQYCQKITKPCLCGMWQIWVTKVKTNYFTIRKSAPQGFRPEGEIPRRHSSNSRVYWGKYLQLKYTFIQSISLRGRRKPLSTPATQANSQYRKNLDLLEQGPRGIGR